MRPAALSETTSRGERGPPEFLRHFPDDVTPGAQPIRQRDANCTIKVQLIKECRVPDGPTGEIESHARLHDRKREIQDSRKGNI